MALRSSPSRPSRRRRVARSNQLHGRHMPAAPASIGARCAHPARSRVAGGRCARQKCVAPRSESPNGLRRHQGDPMGNSLSVGFHDNPSDASDRLPCLALQRDALRRQFDDVRKLSAIGSPCLQFDQGDHPVASAVGAIHTGCHLPVATRPERSLRVDERVIPQRPGHPCIRLERAPARDAGCNPGCGHASRAPGDQQPKFSRPHGSCPDRQEGAWRTKPPARSQPSPRNGSPATFPSRGTRSVPVGSTRGSGTVRHAWVAANGRGSAAGLVSPDLHRRHAWQ